MSKKEYKKISKKILWEQAIFYYNLYIETGVREIGKKALDFYNDYKNLGGKKFFKNEKGENYKW